MDKFVVYAAGFSPWKRQILKRFLQDCEVIFVPDPGCVPSGAVLAVWASGPFGGYDVDQTGQSRILIEDGFVRSVGLGAALAPPLSWVVDTTGIYYDSSRPSDLETLLQETHFPRRLRERAGAVRGRLVASGISKYNVGSPTWSGLSTRARTRREIVLVAGQVEDDASLRYSAPGIRTNVELLKAARAMHPDAWLVYKPHPDVVAGLRRKGLGEDHASGLCDELVIDAPISALLPLVDVVHVLTSLTGFEALLRNRRVVCHGLPFYAGWGLTKDVWPIPRRTRRLTLDDLVAGAILVYPRYLTFSGQPCTAERAIDELLRIRSNSPRSVKALLPVLAQPFLRLKAQERSTLASPPPPSQPTIKSQ